MRKVVGAMEPPPSGICNGRRIKRTVGPNVKGFCLLHLIDMSGEE